MVFSGIFVPVYRRYSEISRNAKVRSKKGLIVKKFYYMNTLRTNL